MLDVIGRGQSSINSVHDAVVGPILSKLGFPWTPSAITVSTRAVWAAAKDMATIGFSCSRSLRWRKWNPNTGVGLGVFVRGISSDHSESLSGRFHVGQDSNGWYVRLPSMI